MTLKDAAKLTSADVMKMLGVEVSASRITCVTLGLDCLKIALQ